MLLPDRERIFRSPSQVDGLGSTYVRPYFRAHRNSVDQTGIIPATATQILFPTAEIDEGGGYDAASSVWVPPEGTYHVVVRVFLQSTGLADQITAQLVIFYSGAPIREHIHITSGAIGFSMNIHEIIRANGAGGIYAYLTVTGGVGNKIVSGDPFRTAFWGISID